MAVQQRTLKTRAKLIDAAKTLIASDGYEALRVEEVVRVAGVAKGTFFAHFADKEVLLVQLIGAELHKCLDEFAEAETPRDIEELIDAMMPSTLLMGQDRYVFDIIIRHSGAAANAEIGPIAETFIRHATVIGEWLAEGPFRKDVSPELLAEGVGAFQIQAIALNFCEAHNEISLRDRMKTYLTAWLLPA